jgi:iron complex outermembrane receptor protein
VQATVNGKFSTAGLVHEVVFGVMSQNLVSTSSVVTPKTYLGTGNLYAPNIINVANINYSGGTYRTSHAPGSRVRQRYAQAERQLVGRWPVHATRASATTPTRPRARSPPATPANKTTPTVALMYKPAADTTLYASYVEALEQSANAPTPPSTPTRLSRRSRASSRKSASRRSAAGGTPARRCSASSAARSTPTPPTSS